MCSRAAAPLLQVGNIMAEYPLDPQLAKMVVASPEFRWHSAPDSLRPSQLNPAAVSLFANVLTLPSRRANLRAKYKRTYHMSTNSSASGRLAALVSLCALAGSSGKHPNVHRGLLAL